MAARAPLTPEERVVVGSFAHETVAIHHVMKNSFLQISKIASTIEPEKYEAFLIYCEMAYTFLHSHHHHEDTLIFPNITEGAKGTEREEMAKKHVEKLMSEHVELDKNLDTFKSYIEKGKADHSALKELLPEMGSLAKSVYDFILEHMTFEEVEFNADVYCEILTPQVVEDMRNKLHGSARDMIPQYICFLIYNTQGDDGDTFFGSRMPWFVRKILFHFWANSAKYAPVWSLCPNAKVTASGRYVFSNKGGWLW